MKYVLKVELIVYAESEAEAEELVQNSLEAYVQRCTVEEIIPEEDE